jgi:hypothetical protein
VYPALPPVGYNPEATRDPETSEMALELDEIEKEEQERLELIEQDFIVGDNDDQESSGTTLWLNATKWPILFANRRLDIIVATKYRPRKPISN